MLKFVTMLTCFSRPESSEPKNETDLMSELLCCSHAFITLVIKAYLRVQTSTKPNNTGYVIGYDNCLHELPFLCRSSIQRTGHKKVALNSAAWNRRWSISQNMGSKVWDTYISGNGDETPQSSNGQKCNKRLPAFAYL